MKVMLVAVELEGSKPISDGDTYTVEGSPREVAQLLMAWLQAWVAKGQPEEPPAMALWGDDDA